MKNCPNICLNHYSFNRISRQDGNASCKQANRRCLIKVSLLHSLVILKMNHVDPINRPSLIPWLIISFLIFPLFTYKRHKKVYLFHFAKIFRKAK